MLGMAAIWKQLWGDLAKNPGSGIVVESVWELLN